MPSRNTLIWVGAAALAVVAAGAGAVVWTYPELLERNPADIPVVARAPTESKPPIVPPAPPPVPATPPAASPPTSNDKASLKPAFDIVNVDPLGEAVIAGRAAPNEKVELRDGGKTVAEATADAAGQFVIIPPTLAPGDHQLSLAASADKAPEPAVSDKVAVSVSAQEAKVAAAAPTNPSGPTRLSARDAHPGDAGSGRWLARCNPIGRGRRRGRPRRQRFGGAPCNCAALSQSGRPRRGQDAIGWPLVLDDTTRPESGRLRHTRRGDRLERRQRGRERRYAIRLSRRAEPPADGACNGLCKRRAIRPRPRRRTRWSPRFKPSAWSLGTPCGLSAKAITATRPATRRSSKRTGRKSTIPMSSFPARCSSSRSRTPNHKSRDAPRPSRRHAPRASA